MTVNRIAQLLDCPSAALVAARQELGYLLDLIDERAGCCCTPDELGGLIIAHEEVAALWPVVRRRVDELTAADARELVALSAMKQLTALANCAAVSAAERLGVVRAREVVRSRLMELADQRSGLASVDGRGGREPPVATDRCTDARWKGLRRALWLVLLGVAAITAAWAAWMAHE